MSEPGGGIGQGRRGRQQGWDPMGELHSLRAELGRLVGGRPDSTDLQLDETEDGWEVIVRLPGVAPDEVAVELDERELCVRARSEAEVNADYGILDGSEARAFAYRVELPSRVDPEAIDAVMDHGLLRIRLPRTARPEPRTITVGRSGARGADGGAPFPVDPAANRELHHPNVETDQP
ncbi:Hsp20/alpha crystallin family protein [Salinispora mooreana]|uniref:Hsp20/alpha crystallin family protein n=1 Tax=Salinispora mooreana TaxID=999545 RepID=UPI00037F595A|nr:Hsp20/alpha crystallin family protein [Salinispora mooreana]